MFYEATKRRELISLLIILFCIGTPSLHAQATFSWVDPEDSVLIVTIRQMDRVIHSPIGSRQPLLAVAIHILPI